MAKGEASTGGARSRSGGIEYEVGARTVRLSSPDKMIFAESGFTKRDVFEYYLAVSEPMLHYLRHRPTTLQRFPDGVGGEAFFQKRVPTRGAPDWLTTATIRFPSGRPADELAPSEPAHIAWAAQMGTVVFHPWPVRSPAVDHPDELRIDLDPQPGTDFRDAASVAHLLHEVLDELGWTGYPKTSGGRGVHVYVRLRPEWTFVQVRRAALALGREVERRAPGRVTTKWWKEERGERVFVDFNQMARDRTIAAPYSLRANRRATVSTPVTWAELADVEPDDLHLGSVPARLAKVGDLLEPMDGTAVDLTPLLEWSERDERDHGLGDAPYPPDYPKMPGEPKRVQPSRARDD